uniref:Unannotated protein n=1 Tax=freshwater metagenome TaxID=449393 RepID=A0A6J5ZVZ4_9ZZZZ
MAIEERGRRLACWQRRNQLARLVGVGACPNRQARGCDGLLRPFEIRSQLRALTLCLEVLRNALAEITRAVGCPEDGLVHCGYMGGLPLELDVEFAGCNKQRRLCRRNSAPQALAVLFEIG